MKKIIITFSLLMSSWALFAQVQPDSSTPVQNTNTGTNVNTTSGNSNSGVNPNGNPGTIINSTTNSNATNSTLQNNPPANTNTPANTINSNQQLTNGTNPTMNTNTYPAGNAPNNNTINANMNQDRNNTNMNKNSTNDTMIIENAKTNQSPMNGSVMTTDSSVRMKNNTNTMGNYNSSTNAATTAPLYSRSTIIRTTNADGTPRAIGLQNFAAVPVLATYVPEQAVIDIVNRFGDTIYDIAMIKSAADQYVYAVRIEENGIYKTELVNANMQ